ncbi:MAG: HypC/HybG/HupF family hydrogenase formation chaperone [Bacteroidetes bacterium]|nr:MAG: HypC/HybG/HupF family hydrogenase formation chaperone [Bacteroidota bacterium]RLD74792.1 MAG: HypC/HybG/HupF family hydrogenase formation chaperone [Bacteroidota bacterium]
MCLAIPGKIIKFTDALDDVFRLAKVDYGGIQKDVNMAMLPEAKIGDYVMVHVGVAISVVDEEEAAETMKFLRQMGEYDAELSAEEEKE